MNTSGFKPAIGYGPTDDEQLEIKRRILISRIALGLLVAGFALQLLATILSRPNAASSLPEFHQEKRPPMENKSEAKSEPTPRR
jgi:hypothetical protein